MSKGKGKEVATKPDWKDELATLDQEMGWDDQESSDWADNSEAADDAPGATMTHCDQISPYDAQKYLRNGGNKSYNNPPDSHEDEEVTSEEMQRTIWDAAVEESRSAPLVGPSTESLHHDDDDLTQNPAVPKSKLEEYLYHRFGPDLKYENRCWCHETLHDGAEEGKQYKREYFARAGTVLIKDPCVLLSHSQEDMPGTEGVDKPVLMVTTPEGESLYPHDMEDYPEPAAATWHGPRLGWGGRTPPQEEYVVPYEDEDGADI